MKSLLIISILLIATLAHAPATFSGKFTFAGKYNFNQPVAGGGGTPAFVGFTAGSGTNPGSSTTVTRTITAGNLLAIGVGWEDADRTVTVSDTVGNTYTGIIKTNEQGVVWGQLFYAKNITGGASVVITASFGSSTASTLCSVWEFSGCSTTTPFDQEAKGRAGSGTAATTASFTTTQANEGLVALIKNFGGLSTTPQASWTEDQDSPFGMEFQHIVVSSAGSYVGAGTLSGSEAWIALAASFK